MLIAYIEYFNRGYSVIYSILIYYLEMFFKKNFLLPSTGYL